jgi:hypothetical protein
MKSATHTQRRRFGQIQITPSQRQPLPYSQAEGEDDSEQCAVLCHLTGRHETLRVKGRQSARNVSRCPRQLDGRRGVVLEKTQLASLAKRRAQHREHVADCAGGDRHALQVHPFLNLLRRQLGEGRAAERGQDVALYMVAVALKRPGLEARRRELLQPHPEV